jgi:GT2 family glycosyltransferase
MKLEIISATRLAESDFWQKSALGNSLRRLAYDQVLKPRISFSNNRGLPLVYNEGIAAAEPESIVVLVHDDVWIDDYFFTDRLRDALAAYDVVGVAGNRRRVAGQPAWAFPDTRFQWDEPVNLSGAVAHGPYPFGAVSKFGTAPSACELLDGVFLAARKSVLSTAEVTFDPRFEFHFYDLDFCRTARQRGLRLGTWPICLTHQSGGAFGTESWRRSYARYLEKWMN